MHFSTLDRLLMDKRQSYGLPIPPKGFENGSPQDLMAPFVMLMAQASALILYPQELLRTPYP